MTGTSGKIDRSKSKLHDMIARGTAYREEYEFEFYGGEEVTAVLKPLADKKFLPIAAFLAEHFDMEDDVDEEEAVSEAIDEVEEAREDGDEDAPIDVTKLDEDFVAIMQEAAAKGLVGALTEDGDQYDIDDEDEARELVEAMMGGYSVEIGGRVLEISGDVRDAEKFRGGRGSVSDTGDN